MIYFLNLVFEYAEDALERMVNPYLRDPIDRVTTIPSVSLDGMTVWLDRSDMCKSGRSSPKNGGGRTTGLEEIREMKNAQNLQSALDLAWQGEPVVEEMESIRSIILRLCLSFINSVKFAHWGLFPSETIKINRNRS